MCLVIVFVSSVIMFVTLNLYGLSTEPFVPSIIVSSGFKNKVGITALLVSADTPQSIQLLSSPSIIPQQIEGDDDKARGLNNHVLLL